MPSLKLCVSYILLSVALLFVLSAQVHARDDKVMFPVEAALTAPAAQEVLGDDIQFFFGDGNHPPIGRTIGNWQSNKKTNGVGYSDQESCNRAFLSAIVSLQKRARGEGGNAVVNIVSFYKRNRVSHETDFECGAGRIMAGVTLRGDVVVLD